MPEWDRLTSSSARTPGRSAQSICTRLGRSASSASWSAWTMAGMTPAEGEDAEPGEEVEVALPLVVDEVAALALLEEAVELDGAEDTRQLRVDVLRMEAEVLALPILQHLLQFKGHAVGSDGSFGDDGWDEVTVRALRPKHHVIVRSFPVDALFTPSVVAHRTWLVIRAKIGRRRAGDAAPAAAAEARERHVSTTSPNIVLVMSDQHRADMMGCAGDPSVQTPVARRAGRRRASGSRGSRARGRSACRRGRRS